jgi:hypothetical protein
MPVFVQWKWIERTKTLLTIFHFYDDLSKPNLRLMKFDGGLTAFHSPKGYFEAKKAWISWAPSHPEMALLMQLLSYANIINGLKPSEKKKIWLELEGKGDILDTCPEDDLPKIGQSRQIRKEIGNDKKVILYVEFFPPFREEDHQLCTCVELCPEYIGYLRKTLNRYLRY